MRSFWKDILREIKNTRGRFLSLLIMTALGAASIVGIQAAAIDMRDIADQTYQDHSLYDLQLKSTTGFSEDDIAALQQTTGVSLVMPAYVVDAYLSLGSADSAVRTYSLPNALNTVDLVSGRLPARADECAVESNLLAHSGYQLGDRITLTLDDADQYNTFFYENTFTIVGVVSSPLYISKERGNTSLGNGSINYYLYLHADAYALDVYTDVYLLADDLRAIDNLSDAYATAANNWKSTVERTGTSRVAAQKNSYADAQRKIDDGWADYNEGLQTLNQQKADGLQQLNSAKKELDQAKSKLEAGQQTLNTKMAEAQAEIDRNAQTLAGSKATLDAQRATLNASQAQIDAARQQLNAELAQLQAVAPQGTSAESDASYAAIYAALNQLDLQQANLDTGWSALAAAQQQFDTAMGQIGAAQATLNAERAKAQTEIDSGWVSYRAGLVTYEKGVTAFNEKIAEAQATLADAARELEDAQAKLDDAPSPEWYYFTRADGLAYDSYYQDTLRLQKVGLVFPLVFFFVAVLVSLTTMSRMVEEHRTQIGVYKALGYRPGAILLKYLIYAFGASILGGLFGTFLGSYLLPRIIADAYGHLYNMPPVQTPVPFWIGLLAIVAAMLSVVVVTVVTCIRSMKEEPAFLMRPKTPSAGKRVLIERIPLVWNRLGFLGKVTARNIFRYKKRFLMTLIGVAGCTALLLTAFGLRDSIGSVSELQFGSIVQYDTRVYLKEIENASQRENVDADLPAQHLYIREESVDANGASGGLSASLIVPESPASLSSYMRLTDASTGDALTLPDDGILVTEKLARTMGVSVGDNFTVTTGSGQIYTLAVTGVVENYVLHYIYLSPAVYASIFGAAPLFNSVFAMTNQGEAFAETILQNSDVRAVVNTDDLLSNLSKSTDALGVVTIVLLVLACALAFVVLFNLTNINISERMRELATIKVLGFQSGELAMYIYREIAWVTLLGIGAGLIGGIFLDRFVISSVEIDLLKFPLIIEWPSFLLAVALSLAFAFFVNWVMYRKLTRINMVESLKNVE